MRIFDQYRAFKTNSWNEHYRLCDRYFAGFYEGRTWPGTSMQRSDMKLHVTSDLTSTVLSSALHTIFFSGGENFFDIVSDETQIARQLTERLRFILHAPISAAGNTSAWALMRALHYIFKYGIGFCGIDYDYNIRRPTLIEISPYDIYWSSSCGPWIDQSPFVFKFTRQPIEQLDEWRNLKGFNVPSRKHLEEFSDYSIDPSLEEKREGAQTLVGEDVRLYETSLGSKQVDVIRVTTRETVKWLTPGTGEMSPILIFEGPNRLGTQPYVSAVYRPILNGMGGVSPVALLAPEHHLQQRYENSRLDMLELHVNPPQKKEPGMAKDPVWGPGVANDTITDKGSEPVKLPDIPPELFSGYMESRARALRTIGTNEMSITGQPKPSNANRTRGGIELQAAAKEERQFVSMLEIESTLVVPALLKLMLSDRVALPQGALEGLSSQLATTEIDPKILQAKMHLEVRGATRMVNLTRLNSVFRDILEYYISPQVQEQAAMQGWMPDFEVLNQFVSDATSTDRKYKLFRRMSEEELQAYQQRQQAQQQAQAEAQMGLEQMRSGNRMDVAELQARNKEMLERLKQEGLSEDRANKLLEMFLAPSRVGSSSGSKSKPNGSASTT